MSKMGNHIIGVQEDVMSTDLENIIASSENISEAQSIVVDLLDLDSFDAGIASDYIAEVWNEFWGNYV